MKLAIPVWNNRISPVFDTATQILVVDIDNGQVRARQTFAFDRIPGVQRGERLAQTGVRIVVCGAVSRPQEAILQAAGIDVIPWVMGNIEDVLAAYCTGDLDRGDFRLPGFNGGRKRRRRGRRRSRNNKGISRKQFRYSGR